MPDPAKLLVVRAALAAAVLLTLITAVGFLGGLWWGFDLAANLRPQYALICAALIVFLAATRSWVAVAGCLVAGLVNVALVVPLYLDGPAPPAPNAKVLRVMSLNVKRTRADPEALIRHLQNGTQADLVFLYSADDQWARAFRNADIPYQVAVSRPKGVDLEIVLLTRTPGLPTAIYDWGPTDRFAAVEVTADLQGTPVKVLGMHPVSPRGSDKARQRDQQFDLIARWTQAQSGPAAVVGDLNVTPWSFAFARLLADGALISSQRGFGLQPSWPTQAGPLGIPIDHALHTRRLTTVERSLGPSFGSSHRSLHVGLAFAAGGTR